MPTNNWGEYSNNTGVSAAPVYPPSATPDPTGDLTPPQSPSGTAQAAPNRAQLNTEGFLSGTGENIPQQGSVAQTSAPTLAGCTSVPWANWNSGAVGSQGSKFS